MRAIALAAVAALLFGCVRSGERPTRRTQKLSNLLIYYGWPSTFDGAGSPRQAADRMARYQLVVIGGGLQRPDHQDHARTRKVIEAIGARARVHGYIPLGHKTGLKPPQIEEQVRQWRSMKVSGIFFDEAGYDFGNTRARQNDAFSRAHRHGLEVFANAHDPDDLFDSTARAPFNPKGAKTVLRAGDHYLYESFGLVLGKREPEEEREAKLRKLAPARRLGVRIWGVTTVASAGPVDSAAWAEVVKQARRHGLTGVGWGAYEYGATLKRVPFVGITP